jgi:Holliday junction resolvase
MMPNRAKQKGDRGERAVVELLNSIEGIHAQRIPLSGAAGGEFLGDVKIWRDGDRSCPEYVAECKVRAKGFTSFYEWLRDNDFLFIKQDREKQLVVMDFDTFRQLLEAKYGTQEGNDTATDERCPYQHPGD